MYRKSDQERETNEEFIRIVEFLHALKIVIEASHRLTDPDMAALQMITALMEKKPKEGD